MVHPKSESLIGQALDELWVPKTYATRRYS